MRVSNIFRKSEIARADDGVIIELPKKLKEVLRAILLVLTSCLIATSIFLDIVHIVDFKQRIMSQTKLITIYTDSTMEINNYNETVRSEHQASFETIFHDENPKMRYYHAVDEMSYFDSVNYFKEYNYIIDSDKLSMFVDVPNKNNDFFDYRSVVTLIDRSITNHSVHEIYNELLNLEEPLFNNFLQKQLPIHRSDSINDMTYNYTKNINLDLNEYVSFLTHFILLFNPINDNSTDILEIYTSVSKSDFLYQTLFNYIKTGYESKFLGVQDKLIYADLVIVGIRMLLLIAMLISLLYIRDITRFEVFLVLIDWFLWLVALISCILPRANTNNYDIFKLKHFLHKHFTNQELYIGQLEILMIINNHYILQLILGILILITFNCYYLDRTNKL